MKGSLTIQSNISEQQLIEICLNYFHSGFDYKIYLFLYAFVKQWNIEKLIYYINLIEENSNDKS